MVRVYEQVDVAAVDGSIEACSFGGTGTATHFDREVQESGSLGSGTNDVVVSSTNVLRGMHFESENNEPNETTWPAGDWIFRFNVTTGNANVEWVTQVCCRLDSGGTSQAQIFLAGIPGGVQALTAGVHEETFSGAVDFGAAASDRFYLVSLLRREADAHGNQTATITNDQLLDTPFDGGGEPPEGPAIAVFMANYRHRTRRH